MQLGLDPLLQNHFAVGQNLLDVFVIQAQDRRAIKRNLGDERGERRAYLFDAGVVISASHNPYQDNGIKVFSPSGKKLADEMERRIEARVAAATGEGVASYLQTGELDWLQGQREREKGYQETYINYLATDVGRGLKLEGLRLALDCANGAASAIAPELFGRMGAQVEVLSAQPDGRNINEACGSLHQEALQRAVVD